MAELPRLCRNRNVGTSLPNRRSWSAPYLIKDLAPPCRPRHERARLCRRRICCRLYSQSEGLAFRASSLARGGYQQPPPICGGAAVASTGDPLIWLRGSQSVRGCHAVTVRGSLPILRRVLAGVFALSWFGFPGFGLIDLSVTWDPEWPQLLEAGWGLYMTMFVGIPFAVIAARERLRVPAAVQLFTAATVLIVSAIPAREWQLLLLGTAIVAETLIVTGRPSPHRFISQIRPTWQPLLIPAALGTIPWLLYSAAMWSRNRQARTDTDITIGIDHYSVQGGYALATVVLVTLAAVWPTGRLLMGLCAGLSSLYLGVVSWAWHPGQASFNRTWSALCVLWGLSVIVLAISTRPKTPSADLGPREAQSL